MAAAGAGLVARFSSTTNVALFVIVTFSFFTVISGKCAPSCYGNAGLVCCGGRCLFGASCFGRSCSFDSECPFNQSCCDDKCVQGKSCLGQKCKLNDHCSHGQSCCGRKCKGGSGCVGEPCQSILDCQDTEEYCSEGTCSKDERTLIKAFLPYILALAVGFSIFLIICAVLVYRCRKRRRLLIMGEIISTNNITTNTNMSRVSVTQCNPLYQPEGPPSDQPTVQPPPYTETPTEGADGMYAHQTDSIATAPSKTSSVV